MGASDTCDALFEFVNSLVEDRLSDAITYFVGSTASRRHSPC